MGFSGTGFSSPLRQPKDEWIEINGGVSSTNSLDVRLRFHCDAAWMMQVANGDDPTGATWQDYQREIPWTLPAGDGTKRVSVRFRLFDGNYSTVAYDEISYYEEIDQTDTCGAAMRNLKILLSYCDTLQTWTGSANQAEAYDRISEHYGGRPPYVRPLVMLSEVPDLSVDLAGVGPNRVYDRTGTINVLFEADPTTSSRPIDWQREILIFKRDVCGIIAEMLDKNCKEGPHGAVFLCIEGMTAGEPHTIPDQDEIQEDGDPELCLQVVYTIRWR